MLNKKTKSKQKTASAPKSCRKTLHWKIQWRLFFTTNEQIRVAWENEYNKEHLSLKEEAEDTMCRVNAQVIFSRD